MASLLVLDECAEIQKKLFFSGFLCNNRVGEITCVNAPDSDDSFIFERFEISGVSFVVTFRLFGEDALIVEGTNYDYKPIDQFIRRKNEEQVQRYADFLAKLEKDGVTFEEAKQELTRQGQDASRLDFKEFTRDILEDTIAPGRKRINGDRNSRIQILQRQNEVPNNSQQPRLNEFILPFPEELVRLLGLLTESERDDWRNEHLVITRKDIDLGCKLPFLSSVINVRPVIYEFPANEMDIEKAAGLK